MKLRGLNITPKAKAERGYYQSYEWKRIRLQHLSTHPLCELCDENDKVIIATVVDHIQQRIHGGSDNYDNLRSLCKSCHEKVTGTQGQEARDDQHPKWVK